MKCPHAKCHSDISTPLKQYNGEWFCPKCKQRILPNETTQFAINLDSHLALKEADALYGQDWLLQGKQDSRNRALELTSNSAVANPYALVALGYYYELERTDLPEVERLHLAYLAYRAVLFNINATVQLPLIGATEVLPEQKHRQLLCTTAHNMHLLVSRLPDNICGNVLGAVSRDKVLSDIESKMVMLGIEPAIGRTDAVVVDNIVDSVLHAITKPSGKCSDSLFALYYLSREQLEELVNKKTDKGTIGKHIGKPEFKILLGDTDNANTFGDMVSINNKTTLIQHCQDMTTSHVHLFFINALGKGAKLPVKVHKELIALLTPSNSFVSDCGEYIHSMVEHRLANKYVFTEDDILIHIGDGSYSRQNLRRALTDIINGEA